MLLLVRFLSGRRTNICLRIGYLFLLLTFSWVDTHAVRLEIEGSMDESGLIRGFFVCNTLARRNDR
jgi:hypothetical protein